MTLDEGDQRMEDTSTASTFVQPISGSLSKSLCDAQVMLSSRWLRRERRILLFFDTFEQIASEMVPWLLDYLLDAHISSNIVLVIAGRDRIDHSTSDGPMRWLSYYDSNTIYALSLNGFTEEETRTYLAARNIIEPDRITTIWRLS